MNDEELKKAIDIIINKPITIQNMIGEDNKEYVGFDKENFETLEQTYYNCQYFARNQEQLMINLKDKDKEIKRLNNIIKRAIEYIENNSLYEIQYDEDIYENNVYMSGASDEIASRDLLDILKGSDKE